MGVFAAEDDMGVDQFPLAVEHVEVVGDPQEVHFGRQQAVVRVVPPVGGEKAQLAACHDAPDLGLDIPEIGDRGPGRVVRKGVGIELDRAGERQAVFVEHGVLQRPGRSRVGLERFYGAYPVEGVQMVEMDDMVLHRLGGGDDVTDVVGVARYLDPQGVLDRPHRRQGMHGGAYAAEALGIQPGVAGVAAL